MKVLFAASEVSPIVKIGGLGDVAGSLPKALEKLGVDVDVIVPFYDIIPRHKFKIVKQYSIQVPYANQTHSVGVYKTKIPGSGVDVLLLKDAKYLSNGGTEAFTNLKNEIERFAFFNRALVEYIKARFNTYDIVHCNDWHTGVATHLLEEEIGDERPATIFTIHNVSYQGQWSLELVQELGLTIPLHRILQWDLEDNNINFMLEGIASSDYVSTVSPSYAKELLFTDIGGQMSEILKARQGRFYGILNGVDYSVFNPKTDVEIYRRYDAETFASGKKINKLMLQKELSLDVRNVPVISIIARLDPKQKGLDILAAALERILDLEVQFVLLGKGDKEYEKALEKLSRVKKYEGKLSINLKFDEGLARKIYAGSDVFLMPSRFEPCGLSQLIAMRYGALPIVHSVGGLKDTVKDGATGFSFNVFNSNALYRSVVRACKLYGSKKWDGMIKQAMKKDFSWDKSAREYLELYSMV
ncbi:glycogen synthase [candidate division WWE3 bacterium]|nr:glycogen synthase [candidate division WWE3 bacterium]